MSGGRFGSKEGQYMPDLLKRLPESATKPKAKHRPDAKIIARVSLVNILPVKSDPALGL